MGYLIDKYGIPILFLINFALWSKYFIKNKIIIRKHFINSYIVKMFVIFLTIFSIWSIFALIREIFPIYLQFIIWLSLWSILCIFELYFILSTLFNITGTIKKYHDIFVIIIALVSIPIILAAILSWTQRTYNPVNVVDFYNMIVLMLGSIAIIRYLLISESFMTKIESYFIFSGFILYFSMHILAGNIMVFDFFKNFTFAAMANLISLIFWLGSLFFIWKIRSKHSS